MKFVGMSSGRKLPQSFRVRRYLCFTVTRPKRACLSCVLSSRRTTEFHPIPHPVDEVVTVISGEFNIGMGKEFNEAQTKPYTAGGLVAMPPGTEHFVWTNQETVVQISTSGPWALKFVNPDDKAQITQ